MKILLSLLNVTCFTGDGCNVADIPPEREDVRHQCEARRAECRPTERPVGVDTEERSPRHHRPDQPRAGQVHQTANRRCSKSGSESQVNLITV